MKGGITMAASIALLRERDRHLGERHDLDVDIRDGEPVGLQHLADLVGRDRAGAVGGDDLALELRESRDLALEVGPQHQVVAERASTTRSITMVIGRFFSMRVEVAGGDAAFDDLQLVLRQQRQHVGSGVELLDLAA